MIRDWSTVTLPIQIDEPGLYPNIPEDEYHADPVKAGSLSSTMAKEILKSPAHLRYYLDAPREEKDVFDFGTLVHSAILGTGKQVEIIKHKTYHSNEAKQAKADAYAAGKIPMKEHEYAAVQAVVEAVRNHPIAGPLFDPAQGTPEVSMFGQHRSGVWLRGRADWITQTGIMVDLKTTQSADPNEFARTAWNLGYDVQNYHYQETYRLATGQRPRGFIHVLVDKNPPHLVTIVQLDPEFLELGESRFERAIARYKHATETNEWPGFPDIIHSVSPQAWMTYAEDDQQDFEEQFNERNTAA